ncbi:MAG: hypothetical protein KM310_00940 [Clostridiales bacterium]|nr:hypothetical protein [Clostridiales bacterium]
MTAVDHDRQGRGLPWIWVLVLLGLPVPIALGLNAAGVPFQAGLWALGALGWLVALGLRGPVVLIARRFEGSGKHRAPWLVVGVSGPAEELVRLAIVRLWAPALVPALT